MKPVFTSHNIRLDDGTYTRPDAPEGFFAQGSHADLLYCSESVKNMLNIFYPQKNKSKISLVDLGCLEGAYSVEFARMGFNVTGMEVRDSNFACCQYVKDNCNLPNLKFVQDNVQNISNYDAFDISYCSGLLYHLHNPREFLEKLAGKTKKVLILQTHFSLENLDPKGFYNSALSENTFHEGLLGRWFNDRPENLTRDQLDDARWASFDQSKSFWIDKNNLIALLKLLGFNTVLEQYDHFEEQVKTKRSSQCHMEFNSRNISEFLRNEYPRYMRGTFYAVRS